MEDEAGRFCKWLRRLAQGLKAWRGLSSFEDPWSEPGSDDLAGCYPDQPHIRPSLLRPDCHDSACGGRAREGEANLNSGILSHAVARFADPDRPGLIRPRR
jgi:hypothetical protein